MKALRRFESCPVHKLKTKKKMFKPGDKAWHPQYGWGEVIKCERCTQRPLAWTHTRGLVEGLTNEGKLSQSDLNPVIFHKEQKFDLSEPEPEIGTWGYFWDDGDDYPIFGQLTTFSEDGYSYGITGTYKHFSPSLPQHIKDMMEGKA